MHRLIQGPFTEAEQGTPNLDLLDRAGLISAFHEEIDPSRHYVSDEEALQRLHDLKSGRVKGLSEEEFWKACGRE